MKLAILGADETTLSLAEAARRHPQWQVTHLADLEESPPTLAAALIAAAPTAARPADWQTLVDPTLVDAVAVARSDAQDRRADQLRMLLQGSIPAIVAHPAFDSMLIYFELDMIRGDTGAVLLPYLPDRSHPAIPELKQLLAETQSPIGKIEQVRIDRFLDDRARGPVIAQFARDADLVRYLCGDVTKLHAMGGEPGDAELGALGVQMNAAQFVARWGVNPALGQEQSRLSLVGSTGRAILQMPADRPWSLEVTSGADTRRQEYPHWNPAAVALNQLTAAMNKQPVDLDWFAAARSVELAETIDRSLRRGRTIELHQEDFSEESTFKGTMASLGCGLLLFGLMLTVAVGVAEQLGIPWLGRWPYYLAAVLVVFLLLQLLLVLSRPRPPAPT